MKPFVSIIITSFNYAHFLNAAIDSALLQTYSNIEVIVVDDGSVDDSRDIIASYGGKITVILKENVGQASAANAGFVASHGDIIIFLDSDDTLFPKAVENVCVEFMRDKTLSKVHWNLFIADEFGHTDNRMARSYLSSGDLKNTVLHLGPDGYNWPPNSGNAWARKFLEKVLPIPESEFSTCPDLYLATLAPLYGNIGLINEPQGIWRSHAVNASFRDSFLENLRQGLDRAERCLQTLKEHAHKMEIGVDMIELRHNSRWHQMQYAVDNIKLLIPQKSTLILVDENHWNTQKLFLGHQRFLFLEKNDQYYGMPSDDKTAIDELRRLHTAGAQYIIIVWPYLWLLDHYKEFNNILRSQTSLVFEDDRLIIFDLSSLL